MSNNNSKSSTASSGYYPKFADCVHCSKTIRTSAMKNHSHHCANHLYPKKPRSYGICPTCSKEVRGYEKKKFCNSSCAAIYTNSIRSPESREKQRKSVKKTALEKFKNYTYKSKTGLKHQRKNFSILKPLRYNETCIGRIKLLNLNLKSVDYINISYSKIDGRIYHDKFSPLPEFLHPCKIVAYRKLAKSFKFKLGNRDSVGFIKSAINEIRKLYEIEKLPLEDISYVLNIESSRFGSLLNTLGIKVKNHYQGILYFANINITHDISDRDLYYQSAKFKFGIATNKNIPGYDLIDKYGVFNARSNINGVSMDHMISRKYGWVNNINPEIIRHPANCQIMQQRKNSSKGSGCSITLSDLLLKIKEMDGKIPPVYLTKEQIERRRK